MADLIKRGVWEHRLQNLLLIDQEHQGLSCARIIEGRMNVVHANHARRAERIRANNAHAAPLQHGQKINTGTFNVINLALNEG